MFVIFNMFRDATICCQFAVHLCGIPVAIEIRILFDAPPFMLLTVNHLCGRPDSLLPK
jgi:hypothetical protein